MYHVRELRSQFVSVAPRGTSPRGIDSQGWTGRGRVGTTPINFHARFVPLFLDYGRHLFDPSWSVKQHGQVSKDTHLGLEGYESLHHIECIWRDITLYALHTMQSPETIGLYFLRKRQSPQRRGPYFLRGLKDSGTVILLVVCQPRVVSCCWGEPKTRYGEWICGTTTPPSKWITLFLDPWVW
jgi:hypothetical protein